MKNVFSPACSFLGSDSHLSSGNDLGCDKCGRDTAETKDWGMKGKMEKTEGHEGMIIPNHRRRQIRYKKEKSITT